MAITSAVCTRWSAPAARVYAQCLEAEVIEGKRKSRGGKIVSEPVHVDQIVKEGDVLPLISGVRVVKAFGHTVCATTSSRRTS